MRFLETFAQIDVTGEAPKVSCPTLVVRTNNSVYQITVTDPLRGAVLVQGGKFFREATRACLSGSSFGGTCLKLAWVGIGMRMEFHFEHGWVLTSRVRSIAVQPSSKVPGPF